MATRYGIIKDGCLVKEISKEELSAECKDYLYLKTSDSKMSAVLLEEKLGIRNYEVRPEGEIRIYQKADSGQITTVMTSAGISVFAIYGHQQDLEGYFLDLMGKKVKPVLQRKGADAMLNLTRMEFRRLFRDKSVYITLASFLGFILIAMITMKLVTDQNLLTFATENRFEFTAEDQADAASFLSSPSQILSAIFFFPEALWSASAQSSVLSAPVMTLLPASEKYLFLLSGQELLHRKQNCYSLCH